MGLGGRGGLVGSRVGLGVVGVGIEGGSVQQASRFKVGLGLQHVSHQLPYDPLLRFSLN